MARSPAQSDFTVQSSSPPPPAAAGSEGAQAVPLPEATVRTSEASAFATKWVLGLTWFMLIAFLLLLVIGPHIPSGE